MKNAGRCLAVLVLAVAAGAAAAGEVKLITSFEDARSPFSPGEVVARHATDGGKSLKLTRGYTAMDAKQDWSGHEFLKLDVFTAAAEPVNFSIEVRDAMTTGYWTRVNYNTLIPPGKSTVIMPTDRYVGEKSRPGRPLERARITRLVFSIGNNPPAPVYIDNVRLERDDSARRASFDGLFAFDFGTRTSPLMAGFTRVTPESTYERERGWGLENARIWRAFDVLQPEPLYEDFLCIESGGLAVDLPNGRYHVFVNIDNPSGYWGEYQKYRRREVLAEGKVVVRDAMDFESFTKRYYRHWDSEDLPADNTFDKYQLSYYDEKEFDVEVADGQLNLEFKGANWACSVSAVVIYPAAEERRGRAFLEFARERRRFHFDNYFKRILHSPTNPDLKPDACGEAAGAVIFSRDYMEDVYYNDRPGPDETGVVLKGSDFAGEYEPLTFSVVPSGVRDLGEMTVTVSDLVSTRAAIPSDNIDVGFVSYRLSRVTMEGSVYTIAPRLVIPSNKVEMPAGVTRRFWLTVKVPADAAPGMYRGTVSLSARGLEPLGIPVEFEVLPGRLDAADVPAGPWGYSISSPWYGDDPSARKRNEEMARKSLAKLREYGFTSFSGMPQVSYRGFEDGKPVYDFADADARMKMAREAGFEMPLVNYTRFAGLDLYYKDEAAMRSAGFSDYSRFVKAVWDPIQKHAEEAGWLPVYWNLADEPIGDNLTRSIENASAYRRAYPQGPPFFSGATSFRGEDVEDPHFKLSRALHVANVNTHDEPGLRALSALGGRWAFYNGGNRWTYGDYMYKAVREFDMQFRLSWHWNVVAGDPYYALDCREDDYAWCNSAPDGTLIPSVRFERLREGLADYRALVTLERLVRENKDSDAAREAQKLIDDRMASFKLGQRNHDALFGVEDFAAFRRKAQRAILMIRSPARANAPD